jgi:hypothetical protein
MGAGGRDPLEGDGKGAMEGRARHRKGGAGPWGSGNGRRRPCLSPAMRKCRRRDRAGAEECPGAAPAYRFLPKAVSDNYDGNPSFKFIIIDMISL